MHRIFLVHLEPIETRYTAQWRKHIPKLIADNVACEIIDIDGPDNIPTATTPGAFLNFGGTNVWKSNQMEQLSRMFTEGDIRTGDHIVFTDAWNTGILQCRYMKELLNIDVKLHGMWHAGSYDPQDFLGRLIKNKAWSLSTEKAIFHALDFNHFATQFHIDMFFKNCLNVDPHYTPLLAEEIAECGGVVRTGWPMEYLEEELDPFYTPDKEDLILFPHRIAPEKQPELFRELASLLPEYKFVMCQSYNLSKEDYHRMLGKAKIVFSANLQETLGISCYEGLLVEALPLVPNRLSYVEMYTDPFKYAPELSEQGEWDLNGLADIIIDMMENYDDYVAQIPACKKKVQGFFHADNFLNTLRS